MKYEYPGFEVYCLTCVQCKSLLLDATVDSRMMESLRRGQRNRVVAPHHRIRHGPFAYDPRPATRDPESGIRIGSKLKVSFRLDKAGKIEDMIRAILGCLLRKMLRSWVTGCSGIHWQRRAPSVKGTRPVLDRRLKESLFFGGPFIITVCTARNKFWSQTAASKSALEILDVENILPARSPHSSSIGFFGHGNERRNGAYCSGQEKQQSDGYDRPNKVPTSGRRLLCLSARDSLKWPVLAREKIRLYFQDEPLQCPVQRGTATPGGQGAHAELLVRAPGTYGIQLEANLKGAETRVYQSCMSSATNILQLMSSWRVSSWGTRLRSRKSKTRNSIASTVDHVTRLMGERELPVKKRESIVGVAGVEEQRGCPRGCQSGEGSSTYLST
ncbi:hypothetical protein BDV98DRAFT_628735 [Pterulicium gracile]|uniref:Uncharacterized protein n=1 Tax=Pterulicium gracile TaxID=1884261 RepID=A0A5C3QDU6_9AGAR|nr:hypothetical protein BDV98DRAFT_628735 [Pterula gracilis]